jgi:ribosome-binding protein aMBF1 (putative translation factor)
MDTAQVMRDRRAELGMSQHDLAQAVGVDVERIQDYETARREPVLSVAATIADALKISIRELERRSSSQAASWYPPAAGWRAMTWRLWTTAARRRPDRFLRVPL